MMWGKSQVGLKNINKRIHILTSSFTLDFVFPYKNETLNKIKYTSTSSLFVWVHQLWVDSELRCKGAKLERRDELWLFSERTWQPHTDSTFWDTDSPGCWRRRHGRSRTALCCPSRSGGTRRGPRSCLSGLFLLWLPRCYCWSAGWAAAWGMRVRTVQQTDHLSGFDGTNQDVTYKRDG